MGRRVRLLAAAVMLVLVTAGGVALADNVRGDSSGNRLVGADGKDSTSGNGGNDDIFCGAQGDRIQGGTGQDDLFGQQGNDFVNAIDLQTNDLVDCGEDDFDLAGIDAGFIRGSDDTDDVAPNCEVLYVGIPTGPGRPSARRRGAAPARTSRPSTPAGRPSRQKQKVSSLEVLALISAGRSNKEIAGELFHSMSTIKTHINRLYRKLGARSRTRAVVRAREMNLL